VQITLSGLPELGPARWAALTLAFGAAVAGAVLARKRRNGRAAPVVPEDLAEARETLRDEVAELERLRSEGRVAREDYEAIHQALGDAIARLSRRLEPPASSAD
jgi:hypothetical protein